LEVQNEAQRLAAEVNRRDGLQVQLRVGLNSGQVIVGEIGSNPVAYTAVGEHVGMAQRMESAAQPGGVMLSESTARLVERTAVLGEPEYVRIKCAENLVPARRLLAIASLHRPVDREESTLVRRDWQLAALTGI
jgi:adenylate cyclase